MTAPHLATRCAACSTVFRVVPDQLRVSEGWVRCGRCAAVFDAAQDLFDIDLGTPVLLDLTPVDPTLQRGAELDLRPGAADAGPAGALLRPALPPFHAHSSPAEFDPGAEPEPGQLLRAPSPDEQNTEASAPADEDNIVIIDHVAGASGASLAQILDEPGASINALPHAAADPADAPTFVRAADHAARWRSPGRRAVLLATSGLLCLLLALQAMMLWRDLLAAKLPALEPVLQRLCQPLGCQVLPLRRIERLSLESSNLGRLESANADEEPRYRLSLLLRNRADTALMLPSLDLSLTDARGKLVARRVLTLAELGASQDTIAAGQELPLQTVLATGGQRIEGYTVELFYP